MNQKYEILVCGPCETPNDAICALLHSTLTHVANLQVAMLEVISEKYGHPIPELVEVLRDSEKFNPQKLALNPAKEAFVEVVQKTIKTKKGRKVILEQCKKE
jgi:hypothetical protein